MSRGLEFHHQLKRDSFDFKFDENSKEYVTINHETQQKNFQGGLTKDEAPVDRRMYATGDENCSVKILKLFIEKTDKNAKSLFNNIYREALNTPQQAEVWYGTKGLAKRTFTNLMADISKGSGLSKAYTPHCLRATAIQAMNDSGFSSRHIMFMSGHRCEASLNPYSRNPSVNQKKALSSTLTNVIQSKRKQAREESSMGTDQPRCSTSVTPFVQRRDIPDLSTPTPLVADEDLVVSTKSRSMTHMNYQNENNLSSLFQSGTFQSCSFNITLNQPQ